MTIFIFGIALLVAGLVELVLMPGFPDLSLPEGGCGVNGTRRRK